MSKRPWNKHQLFIDDCTERQKGTKSYLLCLLLSLLMMEFGIWMIQSTLIYQFIYIDVMQFALIQSSICIVHTLTSQTVVMHHAHHVRNFIYRFSLSLVLFLFFVFIATFLWWSWFKCSITLFWLTLPPSLHFILFIFFNVINLWNNISVRFSIGFYLLFTLFNELMQRTLEITYRIQPLRWNTHREIRQKQKQL